MSTSELRHHRPYGCALRSEALSLEPASNLHAQRLMSTLGRVLWHGLDIDYTP